MNAKKDLLEKCKNLVDEVKINEEGISRQLRKISAEVTTQLEIERKTFRSGHEERQRKVLFFIPTSTMPFTRYIMISIRHSTLLTNRRNMKSPPCMPWNLSLVVYEWPLNKIWSMLLRN